MSRKSIVLSLAVLGVVIWIVYYPALNGGFYGDDWSFLDPSLRLSFIDYVIRYFDPRLQYIWYRPMLGMLWEIDYFLFGVDPTGYHAINNLLHVTNCALLFALVYRLSHNLRLSFGSALGYAGLALSNQAVLWISDPQVLATFFSLLAIWFWIGFLQKSDWRDYILTLLFTLTALTSKETSITLPTLLFLTDRLLIRKPATLAQIIRRYTPIALVTLGYAGLLYRVATYGVYVGMMKYSIGPHLLFNLTDYLALLVLPWHSLSLLTYVVLVMVGLGYGWAIWRTKNSTLIFLPLAAGLTLLPVLPFPRVPGGYGIVTPRYTYMPLMVSGILLGLALDTGWRIIQSRGLRLAIAVVFSATLLSGWFAINDAAQNWAGISRIERLVLKDVSARHPTFPPDTYLYFIDAADPYWGTMFLMRYGQAITVSNIEQAAIAGLRNHANPIIVSVTNQTDTAEIRVDKNELSRSTPSMPVQFESAIKLEGYETSTTQVRHGEKFALILYWRTAAMIDKDYTVFVHLLDSQGNLIDGWDSQPRAGRLPTTQWKPSELYPDGILLTVPPDAPIGSDYHLEIGLYDLATMQRLSIIDGMGQPIDDKIVITPIQVAE